MTVEERFARRAARAGELGKGNGAAADLLGFAAALLSAQGRLGAAFSSLHALEPLVGGLPEDLDRLMPSLSPFLELVARKAPDELAAEASRRAAEPAAGARTRLLGWWSREGESTEDYLSRAFLRPYLELLGASGLTASRPRAVGGCPACSGPPALSVRRPEPESQAGRRFLLCAHCGEEWPFARISCPSCSEEEPDRLPSFQAAQHPGVRIEACESCHRYLKSIDLTLDARPVPEVDDLVSVVLDLWAQEQGFTRIEPGIAGL